MKGTYVLLIDLDQDEVIEIGSLGRIEFLPGTYAYVGSALRGLENRIGRHFQNDKNLHWHIDYLLSRTSIRKAIFGESGDKKECKLAQKIDKYFQNIENFGSSDCTCESHLFYTEDFSRMEDKITQSFRKVGLEPEEW